MYEYNAKIISVYDGDTVRADIDLGFNMLMLNQQIRLLGIDTPEVRGDSREQGIIVRDFVREMILDKKIILRTQKDESGKYGRWLGDIFYCKSNLVTASSPPKTLTYLNAELVNLGYAEAYMLLPEV
jgi:micrococcal nuclease